MSLRLTEDLLYLVFLHSLPSEFLLDLFTATAPSSKLIPPPPPLNYSLVCRSWREIILSRPKLWSEISIVTRLDPFKDYRNPAIERIIKKWLLLSSPALLSIHLQINGDWHGYIRSVILPLLLQEDHRWASVKMEITGHIPLYLPTFRLQCVPTLTSLSLSLWRQNLPAGCVDLSRCVIDNAPGLEELYVGAHTRVRLPPYHDALHLPRLRILHYKSALDTGNFDDLLGVLSACHNLKELQIYIPGRSSFTSKFTRESIYLPRLTWLVLIMSNRLTTNYLLDNLTCPSLRKFHFAIFFARDTEPFEEYAFMEPLRIQQSLTRSCSNPPLEDMILIWKETVPPPSSDLAESLKDLLLSLTKLDTLGLHDYALTQEVVEMLTIPGMGSLGPRLLSSLSIIHVTKESKCDLAEDMFEEMLVSRWKAGSLQAISIGFPRFGEFHKRVRIRDCIEEGLTIVNDSFKYRE